MTTTKKKTTTKPRSSTKTTAKIPDLPPNPFVFEVLELASKQRSKAKKIEVLKKYEHDSLKSIFIWNFDETVISMLPEGEVPYGDPNEQSVYEGSLSENIASEARGGLSATAQDLDGRIKHLSAESIKISITSVKGGNDTEHYS